jgi:hypothetical protein
LKKRTTIAALVVAAAVSAGGLYTGIAQSAPPKAPDNSRQKEAAKMVQDAYRAGKGRLHAQAKQYNAVWRNGQYHFVELAQKIIIVDTPYGPAEIHENNAPPQGVDSQLPPVDPALNGRQPTQAEMAAADAKVNALNSAAYRAAGLPAG